MSDWATRALGALSILAFVLTACFGWQRVSDAAAVHSEAQLAFQARPTPAPEGPSEATDATGSVPPPSLNDPVQTDPPASGEFSAIRWGLARVRVLSNRPHIGGYDRDCGVGHGCVFGSAWNDATDAPDSRNGCDTRNDVLRGALSEIIIEPNTQDCVVLRGILDDPYTGKIIHFLRGYSTSNAIEIDHLIPLAAAWDLGAADWTPQERATFANDTTLELIAVSGPANQAKSDSTPASWLPPNRSFRCEYVARYLRAAVHYGIAVTAADVRAIESVASTC